MKCLLGSPNSEIEEIWKSVKGYDGKYEVSNRGRVKSIGRVSINKRRKGDPFILGKVLKFSNCTGGYRQVVLMKNGIAKTIKIHRLVAKAFIKNAKNKPQVNHIDGNVENNNVSNLEWCTPKENTLHSYRYLGRIPVHGETHTKAILTNDDVLAIRKKYIPRKYPYSKLGKEYGVHESAIGLIIRGKNWKQL